MLDEMDLLQANSYRNFAQLMSVTGRFYSFIVGNGFRLYEPLAVVTDSILEAEQFLKMVSVFDDNCSISISQTPKKLLSKIAEKRDEIIFIRYVN